MYTLAELMKEAEQHKENIKIAYNAYIFGCISENEFRQRMAEECNSIIIKALAE